MANTRIAILGDGGWGTALALVLSRKNIESTVWGAFPEYITEIETTRLNRKFLPGVTLPEAIHFTSTINEVVNTCDILIVAIPTQYLRSVLGIIPQKLVASKVIVSVTKGIENKTLLTPSHIIQEYFPENKIVIMSGPSHAAEVARNIPTCVVASGRDRDQAQRIQTLFMEARFRVYTSSDTVGVELGGALKNVIAIAAGICDGLQFGANTKAALLSRGLHEITQLGVAMGAEAATFFGLSGMGDLVTTCISPYGRNRGFGERVAQGEQPAAIIKSMEMVVEGYTTTRSAYDLATKYTIEMPITREVYRVLFEGKQPLQSISDLMLRDSKDEIQSERRSKK